MTLKILKIIILFCLSYASITVIWQGIEKIMYGEIQPRLVDTIIAIMFACSLTFNLMQNDT